MCKPMLKRGRFSQESCSLFASECRRRVREEGAVLVPEGDPKGETRSVSPWQVKGMRQQPRTVEETRKRFSTVYLHIFLDSGIVYIEEVIFRHIGDCEKVPV